MCLTLAVGLSAHTASAQTAANAVNTQANQELAPPPAPPPTGPEHLLGDWGGLRPELAEVGVNLTLDWVNELAGNPSGGLKQGAANAGQIGVQMDVDWSKLADIRGLATHVIIINRYGSSDSRLIGDNINPVQEIYGGGGNTALHLAAAFAEEKLWQGRFDLAVGRMPMTMDFASSSLYCNFMSNSVCGNPKELVSADMGFSNFPLATFGGRLRVRPTQPTYIQFGVYEVNRDEGTLQDFRSGFMFDGAADSGVEVPVEVGWEPTFGPQGLPGHYKLGFSYDSSPAVKFADTLPAYLSQKTGTGNKSEYWAFVDQMIVRQGPGPSDGIILLGGYDHGNSELSAYAEQAFGGVLDRGFWGARPQDTIGLLFNYSRISEDLEREEELAANAGLPSPNGATGVQTFGNYLEVNYDIHVCDGVTFMPDFQYVFRPNAVSNIKPAVVLGFKSHITF